MTIKLIINLYRATDEEKCRKKHSIHKENLTTSSPQNSMFVQTAIPLQTTDTLVQNAVGGQTDY